MTKTFSQTKFISSDSNQEITNMGHTPKEEVTEIQSARMRWVGDTNKIHKDFPVTNTADYEWDSNSSTIQSFLTIPSTDSFYNQFQNHGVHFSAGGLDGSKNDVVVDYEWEIQDSNGNVLESGVEQDTFNILTVDDSSTSGHTHLTNTNYVGEEMRIDITNIEYGDGTSDIFSFSIGPYTDCYRLENTKSGEFVVNGTQIATLSNGLSKNETSDWHTIDPTLINLDEENTIGLNAYNLGNIEWEYTYTTRPAVQGIVKIDTNSGVVELPLVDPNDSALENDLVRVAKDGAVYAADLVNISDSEASAVRIETQNGTLSWRENQN